ncbi:MAG: hypothetical protein LBV57_00815 [Candidatus Symbiothrix sp.]|jgi:hypothetical protein|nr:hypothetical protein [Candidatus Symbiothrix sp.]
MKYFVPFSFLFLLLAGNLQGQSLEDAQRWFSEGAYTEALPVFETALQSTHKNMVKKHIEIYPALGKIYFSLYQFEKSEAAYTKYAELLLSQRKAEAAAAVQGLIEQAGRAARMLSRCEDVQLIDSVIVDKNRFLKSYLLSSESGSLQEQNGRIIYENPLQDKRYYAEKKEGLGKRLFSEIKLQNDWEDKKELSIPSDSLADNDFPFVLPDGLTVYYASTDKSSIGGYDLYITRYNFHTNTWLAPSQMGMPFNSTANDYMMAIDEVNRIGYFATDRFQPEGKVIVYTFIPNEEFTPLETDDEQALIHRAQIVSIRNTWNPDVDYDAYLQKVRENIQNEPSQSQTNFTFVIDDRRMYHSLLDFKNDAARQAFRKAQEIEKTILQTEESLEDLRREYAFSADKKEQQNMHSLILSKEENLQSLQYQYKLFVKNARNYEQFRSVPGEEMLE